MPEATLEALAYLIVSPVEASAVRYARDWPGAHTVPKDIGNDHRLIFAIFLLRRANANRVRLPSQRARKRAAHLEVSGPGACALFSSYSVSTGASSLIGAASPTIA
jgi:hypothetical protein